MKLSILFKYLTLWCPWDSLMLPFSVGIHNSLWADGSGVLVRRALAQLHVAHQLCLSWIRSSYTVTQALILTQLDCCNVLYMGLPLKTIQKLQQVWNAAAWAVLGASRMVHVTLLFHKLHWLPICFLVQVKVLVIIYNALLIVWVQVI